MGLPWDATLQKNRHDLRYKQKIVRSVIFMSFAESPSGFATFGTEDPETPPMHFETRYQGTMQMYAPALVVAEYLDRHEGWFHRCAQPMRVEPFTEQGYILTVGRFGSFGYEVEPKIAVVFDPPENNAYRMYNVPIPDDPFQGYAVDYNALMHLCDLPWVELSGDHRKQAQRFGDRPIPELITQVNWELHLQVLVQFPKFIYKFPQGLLKSTGDRLLSAIVSQISPRLTSKVQQDFHARHDLPTPPKQGSSYQAIPCPGATDADDNPDQQKEDGDRAIPEEFILQAPTDGQ